MAPTVVQVMDGLEARLATIPGLRVSDVSPGQINPPCAVVGVPDIPDYRLTFSNGYAALTFTVTVFTSAALDRVGQKALAGYADFTGAGSVRTAIEGDKTLGGVAQDVTVDSFRPLGLEDVAAIGFFGGVFAVRVITTGA